MQPFILKKDVQYTLLPGYNLSKVANDLRQEYGLRSIDKFLLVAKLSGKADQIQAGEYHFSPDVSAYRIISAFHYGLVKQYPLTLIEGWDSKQVIKAMQQFEPWQPHQTMLTEETILKTLDAPASSLEGLLYPDTYYVTKSIEPLTIIKHAYERMQTLLEDAWQSRSEDLPFSSPYEALILASIVEKEAVVDSERAKIAGVFIRRLKKNMRLDSDPTVVYALGDNYSGKLSRRDMRVKSPYNTYRNKGLPPTPIAMPSEKSIQAVLHPEHGDSLYFVAKGNGEHHFSINLQEHNQAVRKYLIDKIRDDS